MSPRLTALLAAPALAAMLASGCADEAAAARVGDTTISNDDVMSEVKALTGNEELLGAVYGATADQVAGEADADASYSQQFVGAVLSQRIINVLALEGLRERDVELTDQDLDAAEDDLQSRLANAGLSDDDVTGSARESLVQGLALNALFQEEFGDLEAAQQDIQQLLVDQAAKTDVEISSKYGTWDRAQLAVTPPEGPVQAEGEGDDAELQP